MKKLPIGIQTFSEIIEQDYLYIDKTKLIFDLITEGKTYFLSRPRRFGKSLLISTLKEIYEGNKELFKGLWIYDSDYKWEKYPVVRIDFSIIKTFKPEDLLDALNFQLNQLAAEYGLTLSGENYTIRFTELLRELGQKGKVVILIDEYDKPIIDHITNIPLATEMREIMKGFYTVLKGMDEYLKFVFLTGVSKFSKAGVFSGLNHLSDISMDAAFSSLLGITDTEMRTYFNDYIPDFAKEENLKVGKLYEKIKFWYNGYCFSTKCTQVYNPFSTLMLFRQKQFKNHWFETGTPSFLINLIKSGNYEIYTYPLKIQEQDFSVYELENLHITPLLFQTGYLTIKNYEPVRRLYTLDFPNFEVKNSFLSSLVSSFSNRENPSSYIYQLVDALHKNNLPNVFELLKEFFVYIPYDLHLNYEKYYQSIFYCIFKLIGLETKTEFHTNIGSADMVIEDESIFIFEFKFNGTKEEALKQIKEKKYYEPYLRSGKKIYLLGVEFKDKNIGKWVEEIMIND